MRFLRATVDGGEMLRRAARGQHIIFVPRQAGKNLRNLRRRFPRAQHHFRDAGPQRAMMIEFGKAQVFERHVTQASQGLVGREAPAAHVGQQLAQGGGIHRQ